MSSNILKQALLAKDLALDTETKFMDSRSNGPTPADFGEHEEIPEEAIGLKTITFDEVSVKVPVPVKVPELKNTYYVDVGAIKDDEVPAFISKVAEQFKNLKG